ncbi:unnamed protein product [Penicillium salamii]|nr:unnamed protein product [Penicillium salamii]CAG8303533.1 unnamed protein product [Penicillium salamii]
MFRYPRETEADAFSLKLSSILKPLDVIPWSELALRYLGVPVVICVSTTFNGESNLSVFSLTDFLSPQDLMMVVQDNNYTGALEKLESAGFDRSSPKNTLPPEVMATLSNPGLALEKIAAGFRRFYASCAVFNYPRGDPAETDMQLYVIPDSFAHIFHEDISCSAAGGHATSTTRFQSFGNLHYPLESTLVESFVKAAIDEETDPGFLDYSDWDEDLTAWVSMMTAYLEINNDILDLCPDQQAVEWYSKKFGRIRESKFGPTDRRITKRLGSGKEMPIDMRGNPI